MGQPLSSASSARRLAMRWPLALVFISLMGMILWWPTSAKAQLLRDAEIEQWLHDLEDPLLEAAGIPPSAVGIHIIGDPTINAFVSNGLNMFVNTGLIQQASNPNQVEGVLAHETGHMSGGHLARGSEAIANATRPILLSMVLGAAAIMAGAPDAGMAVMTLGQTVGQSNYLSYSRGQEASADQAAVKLLEKVGQSGKGLVDFFKILRNRQLTSTRNPNPYIQTHPLPSSRVDTLDRLVRQSDFYDKSADEAEMFRFLMIQAKINGFMNSSHATLRKYPLSDQSQPAKYARAVAYYRGAELDKALKEINGLIVLQPDNPFFQELKGQMLFENGRIADSIAPHERSVELAPQYALLRINLGRALVALEDREKLPEAIKVLKAALNMEPDNAFGWTELARAYSQGGNDILASLAQAEAYYAIGNMPEAHRFASRAINNLPQGTPEWREAQDIINAATPEAIKSKRRGENQGKHDRH